MFDKTFYPTPKRLIQRMIAKTSGKAEKALEPSAGKGDIAQALADHHRYDHSRYNIDISAIEKDENLQAILRDQGIKVIDSDFLTYSGPDKFDLIIGNPPFEDGDLHLLKAIDIMYRGEIVFLLNAETIKNPYTKTRKILKNKLEELKAEIEYIQDAFVDAERKTSVEVALVYINIERSVEEDLFKGADDTVSPECQAEVEDRNELSTGRTVKELVAEYNRVVATGTETIISYYRNYKVIGKYIGLNHEPDKYYGGRTGDDLTGILQDAVNAMLPLIRTDFWRRTLNIEAVRNRLTTAKQSEFEAQLTKRSEMDFTESNIQQFVLNIIGGYEQTLTEAVLTLFDKFTVEHCYSGGLYDKNIHLFNGWKTNKAFKVGKKVIIPIYGCYGNPFIGYSGWELRYDAANQLNDIDKVMNYFDGMINYTSMADAITWAFENGQTSKIKSTYFTITVYKKGTIHLTFNSDDILRRFNVVACKGKKWLMDNYGSRPYNDMTEEGKGVVDSFEGQTTYAKNLNRSLFAKKSLQLCA